MKISVEISYYPLVENFIPVIKSYIERINQNKNVEITTSKLSTLIIGEYDEVMQLLNDSIKEYFEKYPSVYNLKIVYVKDKN
ncbi:MAG TPA: YkoF family thiamine/hydroxymethylpyrimidine-binding protein [Ignavibacteriales bacterium]|nr:YkoF family thiamine/hydroxymethylpyrimidine-binding protein [Ignavibacteriales bacterium]HOL81839.1 YkoF family thiamine/hydroxymethylpyrimidine-binding protein [Ignavibacteriales bacterium]HOM65060.1 YkoF family thiamine/hydroxymethylpyrimidine-binding protein [Ignavibacteriales bacterium]HPD67208.1 YkoF family thiamine/hydroxymethylpyrimidine-binding protein [Ignavibacteriales bacterium]HPP34024.1 YkoF family thiamine/hydroxymethylpyrimidine-binding protein [Ignavibacteriales bacterium]